MRLRRLTGLEREKIEEEYKELLALIEDLKAILASEARQRQIIKDELDDMKKNTATLVVLKSPSTHPTLM